MRPAQSAGRASPRHSISGPGPADGEVCSCGESRSRHASLTPLPFSALSCRVCSSALHVATGLANLAVPRGWEPSRPPMLPSLAALTAGPSRTRRPGPRRAVSPPLAAPCGPWRAAMTAVRRTVRSCDRRLAAVRGTYGGRMTRSPPHCRDVTRAAPQQPRGELGASGEAQTPRPACRPRPALRVADRETVPLVAASAGKAVGQLWLPA
jgi:hypothetical protein